MKIKAKLNENHNLKRKRIIIRAVNTEKLSDVQPYLSCSTFEREYDETIKSRTFFANKGQEDVKIGRQSNKKMSNFG